MSESVGERYEWVVGVFVVVGVAALAVMIFAVGAYHPFERGYVVRVGFSEIGGLAEKAPVQISGAPLGRVEKIHLHSPRTVAPGTPGGSAETYTVTVEVFLDEQVELYPDLKAEIASIGFAGEKIVSIRPGRVGARLGEGAFVRGTDPVSIPELLLRAQGTIEEFQGVLHDVRPLTRFLGDSSLHEEVRSTVTTAREATEEFRALGRDARADLAQVTARVNATVEKAGGEIEAAAADLRLFAADVRDLARETRGRVHTMADAVEWSATRTGDSVQAVLAAAAPALEDLRAAAAEARAASTTLRRGVEAASADVTATTAEARAFVTENRTDLEAALRAFRVTGEEMRLTLESIRRVAEAVDRGEGTMGVLLRDEQLARDVRETAENLKDATEKIQALVDEIRRSPRRFVRFDVF